MKKSELRSKEDQKEHPNSTRKIMANTESRQTFVCLEWTDQPTDWLQSPLYLWLFLTIDIQVFCPWLNEAVWYEIYRRRTHPRRYFRGGPDGINSMPKRPESGQIAKNYNKVFRVQFLVKEKKIKCFKITTTTTTTISFWSQILNV